MVKEVYYAIKGDSLQTRRESDDVSVIFSRRGSVSPGVPTEYSLYENIEYYKMCIDLNMLKVKVPVIFSGT